MSKSKIAVAKSPKADGQRPGAAKEARIQANGKPGESSAMGSGKGKAKSVATTDAQGDDAGEHDDELMESLRKHDASFTALLSLIPAHLYLAAESDSEEGSVEGDAGRANGQKRKQDVQADANERKARIKEAKRAKFDPDNHKNAIEVQKEREAAKQERRKQEEQQGMDDISFTLDAEAMHAGDTDEEGDDDSMPDGDDSEDDGESYETLPTSAKGSEDIGSEKPSISSPLPGAASTPGIFDLRARLQAKIQGLQAQRRNAQLAANGNAASDDSHAGSLIGDDESTASTKDELLEERRKKRGEMRDNRRRQAKERKRAEREQLLRGGAAKKSTGSGNDNKAGGAPALFVSPKANGHSPAETAKDAPSADYAFSAMQFDGQEHSVLKRHKHALPSDPKAALAILDARKRKEEARQSKREAKEGSSADADAGEDRSSLLKWGKAEAAAQGIKIRDDEALLRKALKKREKQKAKSTKEWKKRGKDIVQQQAARQKKRRDNIAARKDKKTKGGGAKSSSSSSAKVKGYSAQKGGSAAGGRGGAKAGGKGKKAARPGFEGRSRSFGGGGGGGGGKGKKGGK